MAYKAQFRTALNQKETVINATLAADVKVGYLCTFNGTALAAKTSGTAAVGDCIVAQSDMTMEYGHVPVENRDYRYDDKVAASTTAKKVAVFKVIDADDVYTYQV